MRSSRSPAGFTLLEIMLAVAILLLISVALTRFTEATVQAAQMSTRGGDEDEACAGLRRLLAAQLAALPGHQSEALVGMMIKGSNGRRDALQMVCPSGNALLTPDARGLYQITLLLREIPRGSGKLVLGLGRQPWTGDDDDDDDDDNATATVGKLKATDPRELAAKLPADWIPLMPGVNQLEIAYFDSRLNSWVDRWTDASTLPSLVRLRLTLADASSPYELVQRVPGGGIKDLPPPVQVPVPQTGVINAPPGSNSGSAAAALTR